MSDELEARIRRTEDYQEITNLQAQCFFLTDERRTEALLDLFVDDLIREAGFDRMTTVTSKPEMLLLYAI